MQTWPLRLPATRQLAEGSSAAFGESAYANATRFLSFSPQDSLRRSRQVEFGLHFNSLVQKALVAFGHNRMFLRERSFD
jgi:hypothetical protein